MGFVLPHRNIGLIFALVFLNVLTFTISEKTLKVEPEEQNRPRRHLLPPTRVYTYIKHHYRTSKSHPRILNSGPPLKIVHTGPFYVNHHVHYDSNAHNHGLGASHHVQEEVSFVNDVPIKIHHFNHDVKIGDPSTSNGIDFLKIDLEQNKHLDNFEVNLPSITVSEGNKFGNEIVTPLVQGAVHLREETFKVHDNDFNLANHGANFQHQGTVHVGGESFTTDNHDFNLLNQGGGDFEVPSHNFKVQNHQKYNENLDAVVEYLKESGDAIVFGEEKRVNEGHQDKTNQRGEFLSTPNLTRHPLETDHGKSSYDTPGAVDSYGHPVSENSTPLVKSYKKEQVHGLGNTDNFGQTENHNFNNFNHTFDSTNANFAAPEFFNNFKDSFESLDQKNFANDINHYFQNQFDNGVERLRRSNKDGGSKVEESIRNQSTSGKTESSTMRYNNHKYE